MIRLLLLALLLAPTLGWAANPPRGYQERKCGFDLDADGVYGETDECNFCDGVTTDPDGDGVQEDINYVNCNSGTNSTTCGAPGSPCKSIAWALNGSNSAYAKYANGPSDGQEDIVCFKGTCVGEPETSRSAPNGVGGTPLTKAATGSEERSWEYPDNPGMLIGWDADNDGCYWPYDDGHDPACGPAEIAPPIIEGAGRTGWTFGCPGYQNSEIAHFQVQNWNEAQTAAGGFHDLSCAINRYYQHDLKLLDINRAHAGGSATVLWQTWISANVEWKYVAVENIICDRCGGGGYGFRGAVTADAEEAGPYRIKNLDMKWHGCGAGNCSYPLAGMNYFKVWGNLGRIEYIDGKLDVDRAAWTVAPHPYALQGFIVNQDLRAMTIRNNEFIDLSTPVWFSPCFGEGPPARPAQDMIVDGNWMKFGPMHASEYQIHAIDSYPNNNCNGTTWSTYIESLEVTNNMIAVAAGVSRMPEAIQLQAIGQLSCPPTGEILIANNTVSYGGNPWNAGLLTAYQHSLPCGTPITLKNNILANSGSAAPYWQVGGASVSASHNVYPVAVSGYDSAGTRKCAPTWVSGGTATPGTHDLHLHQSDSCARDWGTNLSASFTKDIDQETRAGSWDIGADEGAVASCTTNTDCNDSNVCTTDTCSGNLCQWSNNIVSCNDSLFCNGTDTCAGGVCGHAGDPCSGADGDSDCTESCDETADDCLADDPEGSSCGASNECYGGVCTAVTTTTTTTTTTTLPMAGSLVADIVALWQFEGESSGGQAIDTLNANNLTQTSTVNDIERITTAAHVWQGAQSAKIDRGTDSTGERLACTDATCPGLRVTGDISFGGAIKPTGNVSGSNGQLVVQKANDPAMGNTGYEAFWQPGTNRICCLFGDGSDNLIVCSANDTAPVNTYTYFACDLLPDTASGAKVYINGEVSGTPGIQGGVTANSRPFIVSDDDLAFDYDGYVDSLWVGDRYFDVSTHRYIRACDPDGANCDCDSGDPTLYKACTTNADCDGGAAICSNNNQCKGRWATGDSALPNCNITQGTPVTTTTTSSTTTLPLQACCFLDGSCTDVPTVDCTPGVSQGAATACITTTCPTTTTTTTTTLPTTKRVKCRGCKCRGCSL